MPNTLDELQRFTAQRETATVELKAEPSEEVLRGLFTHLPALAVDVAKTVTGRPWLIAPVAWGVTRCLHPGSPRASTARTRRRRQELPRRRPSRIR